MGHKTFDKRPSVFAVTENGETRYGMTKGYGGLSGVAIRFIKNAMDQRGNVVPYFERLKYANEIEEGEYQYYADHPEDADKFVSFIGINVDEDKICVDEDMPEERIYREYPLQLVLETAEPLIIPHPYTGYEYINKKKLYSDMDSIMYRLKKEAESVDESMECKEDIMEETDEGESVDEESSPVMQM